MSNLSGLKPHLMYLTVLDARDSFTYDSFWCNEDIYGKFESHECGGAFACLCYGDTVCPEWLGMIGVDVLRKGPQRLAYEIDNRSISARNAGQWYEAKRLSFIALAVAHMPMDCWLAPERIQAIAQA